MADNGGGNKRQGGHDDQGGNKRQKKGNYKASADKGDCQSCDSDSPGRELRYIPPDELAVPSFYASGLSWLRIFPSQVSPRGQIDACAKVCDCHEPRPLSPAPRVRLHHRRRTLARLRAEQRPPRRHAHLQGGGRVGTPPSLPTSNGRSLPLLPAPRERPALALRPRTPFLPSPPPSRHQQGNLQAHSCNVILNLCSQRPSDAPEAERAELGENPSQEARSRAPFTTRPQPRRRRPPPPSDSDKASLPPLSASRRTLYRARPAPLPTAPSSASARCTTTWRGAASTPRR